jgi:hypothetical protein
MVRNDFCRGEILRLPSQPSMRRSIFAQTARRVTLRRPHETAILRAALSNSIGPTKCTVKTFIYIVCLFMPAGLAAAIPMARVINVIDSHTIHVEVDGRRNAVILSGVTMSPGEETAAFEHLHRLLDGAWVYVEDGNVYRSPDGLFVNGEMQRHAWRSSPNMRYLGLADPGPRTAPAKGATVKVKPPKAGNGASRSEAPRRVPVRRSPARHLP